jgi:3-deoxy-7-phosphoheptulonate synthase
MTIGRCSPLTTFEPAAAPALRAVRREDWPDLRALPAEQQPGWPDGPELRWARDALTREPSLVTFEQIDRLRSLLAEVAAGRMQVVQAGDCAEDPADTAPERISRKVGLLDALAGVMRMTTGLPVVRVGRLAGQYAKPRSNATERIGSRELPVYRGAMVNAPDPRPEARRPDPMRMLRCHRAAARTTRYLSTADKGRVAPLVWTSHEALVLDYETPQLRHRPDGRLALASTHWPWIGERTRQPDGAHVALLAAVGNPVACKIGPSATPDDVLELCARLDPDREPGRFTLITRMGADVVADALPPLVEAVRSAGHPVIWMCDPMHANTEIGPGARKVRYVDRVKREIAGFVDAVVGGGGVAGGLHLEATPDPVTECVSTEGELADADGDYTTLCDPRLNAGQALEVATAWRVS